ncbi:MAG: hypothetical protein RBS17_09085 [Coriobacteriia bacterium]|nr:hypothetical protein [Coriobacteriia bacterium]
MRRFAVLCVVGLACGALFTGCGDTGEPASDAAAPAVTTAITGPLEGYDAMPADEAGEAAAAGAAIRELDELSGSDLSAEQREMLKTDQRLIAYLVRVELDAQVALFEVRADGLAHNIYSYPRAFDSGSIIWTPAESVQVAGAAARSEGEIRAVASVDEAMRDAFPDGDYTVSLGGYRFAFLAEEIDPVHIEIAADGTTLISVSR